MTISEIPAETNTLVDSLNMCSWARQWPSGAATYRHLVRISLLCCIQTMFQCYERQSPQLRLTCKDLTH